MDVSQVQLGHSNVFLLNDDSVFKRKLEETAFCRLFGVDTRRVFVGPQPVSVERKDIADKLFTKNYLVCEKSDGERMYLFITKIDGKHGIFFVNRAMKFYIAPFKFNEECFEGVFLMESLFNVKMVIIILSSTIAGCIVELPM